VNFARFDALRLLMAMSLRDPSPMLLLENSAPSMELIHRE